MGLYNTSVTTGMLVPANAVTSAYVVPVFYGGTTYKATVGDILALVTKTGIGLGNVDNTSDINKPLSSAVQAALATKADANHTHAITQVNGLVVALSEKAPLTHSHVIADIAGLETALITKAPISHVHEISQVNGLTSVLSAKADTATVNTQLAGKSAIGHTHNASEIIGLPVVPSDIATQPYVIAAIAAAPVPAHTHEISQVNGLSATLSTHATTTAVNTLVTAARTDLESSITATSNVLSAAIATKAPANHTHLPVDILDFNPSVKNVIRDMVVPGANVSIDTSQGNLVISATGGGAVAEGNSVKIVTTEGNANMVHSSEVNYAEKVGEEIIIGQVTADYVSYMGDSINFLKKGTYRLHIQSRARISDQAKNYGLFEPSPVPAAAVPIKKGYRLSTFGGLVITGMTTYLEKDTVDLMQDVDNMGAWGTEYMIVVQTDNSSLNIRSFFSLMQFDGELPIDPYQWIAKITTIYMVEALSNPEVGATKTMGINAVRQLTAWNGVSVIPGEATYNWDPDGYWPSEVSAFLFDSYDQRFTLSTEGIYRVTVRITAETDEYPDPVIASFPVTYGTQINKDVTVTAIGFTDTPKIIEKGVLVTYGDGYLGSWTHEYYLIAHNPNSKFGIGAIYESLGLANSEDHGWVAYFTASISVERLGTAVNYPNAVNA